MKVVIGMMTATKPGSIRLVSSRNTKKDRPRSSTSSMKRSDWVSQTSAASPVVTASSATANWRRM